MAEYHVRGMILAVCAAAIAVVGIAVFVFRVPYSTVFLAGLFLLCPLLHIIVTGRGGHNH